MRKGDWAQTYTGGQFWALDPCWSEVCIIDIAHALGKICRYGGHTRKFYSVAEHSVWVSRHLPEKIQLEGLLHDAPEAYTGDIIRPIKTQENRLIEDDIMHEIAEAFDLKYGGENEQYIKRIDSAILADEKKALMAESKHAWFLPEPPLGIREFYCWGPEVAPHKFLERFFELYKKRT